MIVLCWHFGMSVHFQFLNWGTSLSGSIFLMVSYLNIFPFNVIINVCPPYTDMYFIQITWQIKHWNSFLKRLHLTLKVCVCSKFSNSVRSTFISSNTIGVKMVMAAVIDPNMLAVTPLNLGCKTCVTRTHSSVRILW